MENQDPKEQIVFLRQNSILLIIGILIIIIGFALMAGGGSEDPNVFNGEELFSTRRITIAPITVLIGYVVVMLAIMKKPKQEL